MLRSRFQGPSVPGGGDAAAWTRTPSSKKNDNMAYFYTIITSNSVEENFAHNRQLFLTEQGYTYTIMNEEMFKKKFG